MKDKMNLRFGIISTVVLVAALSRLVLTELPNVSPLGAMALFGGAYFSKRYLAVLIPLLALWISDVALNNTIYAAYYEGFSWFGVPVVYLSIIVIALMGTKLLKKVKIKNLLVASLLTSLVFFFNYEFRKLVGDSCLFKRFGGYYSSLYCWIAFLFEYYSK